MSIEIERKFLVASDAWAELVADRSHIKQAYLALDGKATVRIRIKDRSRATLTVKSRGTGLRRLEFEYPVPLLEAEAMIVLRQGAVIEKHRSIVPCNGMMWEVDTFLGDNAGLVIAEIELQHENQTIDLPPWIGREVTGQAKYYNSSLTRRPYCTWSGSFESEAG